MGAHGGDQRFLLIGHAETGFRQQRGLFRFHGVHVGGGLAAEDHCAALFGKFTQQRQGGGADREHIRHDHGLVDRLPDAQHRPSVHGLHRRQSGHHLLFAVIEIDLPVGEKVEELRIAFLIGRHLGRDVIDPLRPAGVGLAPEGFNGVEQQHVAVGLPFGEHQPHAGEVVLHGGIVFIPRGLVQDRSGVVPLGLALHRVPGQVLAADVDPEQRLPVSHVFMALEAELPAGHAVQL